MYENSELDVLKDTCFAEIANSRSIDLFGTNVYKTLKFC